MSSLELTPSKQQVTYATPAKVDLSWLERAFNELPEGFFSQDTLPLDHPDVPKGGYRIVDNVLEKWIPTYESARGMSVQEVVLQLEGNYTPKQVGWRIESRQLADTCQCSSGSFELIQNRLVHTDGCGRAVAAQPNESPEEYRLRLLSISLQPDDEYLNGMYPTLGGRDANDPKSWITRGRSEYRQRTKGMIHWGSSSEDKAKWDGNTLSALDRVRDSEKNKQRERIELAAEKWSKKVAPRQLGEL